MVLSRTVWLFMVEMRTSADPASEPGEDRKDGAEKPPRQAGTVRNVENLSHTRQIHLDPASCKRG